MHFLKNLHEVEIVDQYLSSEQKTCNNSDDNQDGNNLPSSFNVLIHFKFPF